MHEPIDLDERITAMHKRTVSLTWLAALTGLLALSSCEWGTNSGMGTVRLYMVSVGAPAMVDAAALVNFGEVTEAKVVIDSAVLMPGHVLIPLVGDAPVVFDLLDMQGDVTTLLAAVPVLGVYEQLRLFVGPARVSVMVDEETIRTFEEEARFPSGQQTGIKINFGGPIEVGEGAAVDLMARFMVDESFVFQGPPDDPRSVVFKPVIHAWTEPWSSIAGTVTVPNQVNVEVTVQAVGSDMEVKADTVFNMSGPDPMPYKLRFLDAGTTYTVQASANPSTGLVTPDAQDVEVNGQVTGVNFVFTSTP